MEQPAPSVLPPLRENSAIVSVPSAPPKTPPRRVDAVQGSSAGAAVRDSIGNAQDALAPNQATAKVPTAAAPVTKPAGESNRSQVASTPPASWPQQDVRVTTPLTSVVSPPREAVSAGLENRTENRSVAGESPSPPKHAPKPAIVSGTVAILTDPYPSIRLPHAPSSKKSRRGTSLQLGQLIARVEPAYPEEAKQQGIEGTVKMHVLVSREGIVQQLVNVDGPALLVPATVHAVQQWRYTETMLAGQAVETEDDIAVTFRLVNHGAANK
jgi:Gram-negative bacterial TonB protein C-terminal